MFKRIISLALIIVMLSSLFCTIAHAAVFDANKTTITPMVKDANYEIYLKLNVTKPYNANNAYIAVYNKNGRMTEIKFEPVEPRMFFYVKPEEYPATIKAFIWSASKTGIPYCESYKLPELESANKIISDHLASFIEFIYNSTSKGNFMYELNVILDKIDEEIIEDAKNDKLVIDKKFLSNKYPDVYAEIKALSTTLETEDEKNNTLTALSNIINNYPNYKKLVLTLFTLLDVYQYI